MSGALKGFSSTAEHSQPPSCVVFVQKAQRLGEVDSDVEEKLKQAAEIVRGRGRNRDVEEKLKVQGKGRNRDVEEKLEVRGRDRNRDVEENLKVRGRGRKTLKRAGLAQWSKHQVKRVAGFESRQ